MNSCTLKEILKVNFLSFTKEEIELIKPIIDKMPNIIEDYFKLPFDNVMNKYN